MYLKTAARYEINRQSITTQHLYLNYHANLKEAENRKLFLGSVNDFLARAMKGDFSDYIPSAGEVDFITAGSPYQGFSNANNRKTSDESLANISLVASVAVFVDFYCPTYGLPPKVWLRAKRQMFSPNWFAHLSRWAIKYSSSISTLGVVKVLKRS